MQRPLRHRFWLPLLLLIIGYNHRCHKSCEHESNCNCDSSTVWGPTLVNADKICKETRCNPDCICMLQQAMNIDAYNNTCADLYGNWGWIPPNDAPPQVWKNLGRVYDINYGTIQPTGMRGANRLTGIGRGAGKITNITNTTLTGQVYLELHPDQLSRNLGWYHESLIVEMYGGIEFGLKDCTKEGIMLGHRLINMSGFDDLVDNFDWAMEEFEDYNEVLKTEGIECHPRAENAKLAAVNFILQDPFYYHEESPSLMNIWYPFRKDVKFGSLEFCIHVEMIDPSFESEDDDFTDDYFKKRNVTSYFDTKFKVDISEPTIHNNFTRFIDGISTAKIYSNKEIGPTEGLTTLLPKRYNETKETDSPTAAPTLPSEIVIPVTTYQCSAPDESDIPGSYDHTRTFTLGQTFRLCVGPTKPYEKEYQAIGFQSVICENGDRNLTIIDEFGVPDNYTTVDRNIIGYTKKRGGIITSNKTLSISSVINSDLAGVFPESKHYFVCSGIVYLQYISPSEAEEEVDVADNLDGDNDTAAARSASNIADSESQPEEDDGSVRRRAAGTENHPNTRRGFVSRIVQEEPENNEQESNNAQQEEGTGDEKQEEEYEPKEILWDKIELNNEYGIPIVGSISIRIDLSDNVIEGKVNNFVSKSVDTLKGWFQVSSSASRTSVLNSLFLSLGTTVMVQSLLFFA